MNKIFAKSSKRPSKTINDKVAGIDSRSISAIMNDREKPPTTLSFYLCHMETSQNTFGDRQRPWKTANDWQWVSLAPKVAV